MNDSDRNIIAGLRHESCETHCDECGACDWRMTGPNSDEPVPMVCVGGDRYLCPDCLVAA